MNRTIGQYNKGFTLIEVLVAIFILSIGVMGLAYAFPQGIQMAKNSEKAAQAVTLAQAKIEEIISTPYNEVFCSGEVRPTCIDIEDYGSIADFASYKRRIKITCIDGDDFSEVTDCTLENDPGMKKIEVTVFWKMPFSLGDRKIELISLVSNLQL
ncbi:unnamed protein product [marine sediment metagenome]|uniref:Prepilin-type N-terminal cleavage/methylation domain-containing protein n=1 Tax=marine sediment metagenome TaxID=412755 RepID=X0WHP9_9ZZZZ